MTLLELQEYIRVGESFHERKRALIERVEKRDAEYLSSLYSPVEPVNPIEPIYLDHNKTVAYVNRYTPPYFNNVIF